MDDSRSVLERPAQGPEVRTHLERRRPLVAMATHAVALLAWVALVTRLLPMPGDGAMHDLAAPGGLEAMATGNGVGGALRYLVMWGVMMVAMMYPSSAGIFQWYADVRGRPTSWWTASGVAVFVGVYTLLWVVVGLAPLAVDAVVPVAWLAETWTLLYFGVALLAVGAFQLSSLKRHYLTRCRNPSGFVVDREGYDIPGAARLGWEFGRQDLGSCGPLMGLMVVVGSMNLVWMALITVLLSIERLTAQGPHWARRFGLVMVVAGAALVVVWLL